MQYVVVWGYRETTHSYTPYLRRLKKNRKFYIKMWSAKVIHREESKLGSENTVYGARSLAKHMCLPLFHPETLWWWQKGCNNSKAWPTHVAMIHSQEISPSHSKPVQTLGTPQTCGIWWLRNLQRLLGDPAHCYQTDRTGIDCSGPPCDTPAISSSAWHLKPSRTYFQLSQWCHSLLYRDPLV